MKALFFLLVAHIQTGGVSQDSVEAVQRQARRAESRFEQLARRLAPFRYSGMDGSTCDEIVGRFCLRYDSGEVPEPPPEPDEVLLARRLAIEALRRSFAVTPHLFETAGPLVRYLVEDDRASEGESAARTYYALSQDSTWGPLLLGFALHALGDDTAATRLFEEGLPHLDVEARRPLARIDWLLSAGDRGVWNDHEEGASRDSLVRAFWTFADPLYLTPGNERYNQHIARFIWSRLLERAPLVTEALRWGGDLEELTIRYGTPAGRTRTPGRGLERGSLVDHFDPSQLAYVPADFFASGPPAAPLPGEEWLLDEPRSRSGYAPVTIRKPIPLPHQLTRFPTERGMVVRVDALLPLDSVAAGKTDVRTGLWLRDAAGLAVATVSTGVQAAADTARFAFELDAPAGARLYYSAEALEPETRFAGRARYVVPPDTTADGVPRVSDPLIARPFGAGALPVDRRDPALRPTATLYFAAGDTIGIYAEVYGLGQGAAQAPYAVRLSMTRVDRRSVPVRLFSWIGDKLGLSEREVPPRLSWSGATPADGPAILAVDLHLADRDPGLYALDLAVTDQTTGRTTVTRRIIRIDG